MRLTRCIQSVQDLNTCGHRDRCESQFSMATTTTTTSVSPLGAVLMAGLALACLVGVFPDDCVSVARHAVGAACHTVGAVLNVGTLGALVRTLQEGKGDGLSVHEANAWFS